MKNIKIIIALMLAIAMSACTYENSNILVDGCGKPNDVSEVKICNQIWRTKNLDVDHYRNGDPIPEVTDHTQWANLTTGAWCYYDNDPVKGKIYGKLYNWYAVNDPRGLAPVGWHIPSNIEWEELTFCLGGKDVTGGKLKSIGTLESNSGLWYSPNTGATNECNFNALPCGYRSFVMYDFEHIGFWTWWWSSTESGSGAHAWCLNSQSSSFNNQGGHPLNKLYGFSVRCIRD